MYQLVYWFYFMNNMHKNIEKCEKNISITNI